MKNEPDVEISRPLRRLSVTKLTLVVAVLMFVVPVAGAEAPNTRRELTVSSHGDRDWARLHQSEWCPENSEYCQITTVDYAADEDPDELPIHPGGLMRLQTGREARGLSVAFNGTRRRQADRRDDSGRRWKVRVPRTATAKTVWLSMVVDYRYRKDGKLHGGRFDFEHPAKRHRHD